MQKIKLEWKILNPDQVALLFDKHAWRALQSVADAKGIDTGDMIVRAIADLLGTVVEPGTAH